MSKKRLIIQYNAPVILTFALLSLGTLMLDVLTGGWSSRTLFCVYRAPLSDPLTYVRMVGHVLGHADYAHYLSNMMLLLVIGPPLEEKYGSQKMLSCILITAVVSGLVQFVLFPGIGLLGASGVVFMMIILSSLSGMRGSGIPLTLILVAFLYLGGEVADAVLRQDNVSQLTHIVGCLCGGVLGYSMSRKRHK